MTATKRNPANGSTVVSDADRLSQKEREVRRKHPRVIKGTIRKETDGAHAGKITVEITCAMRGCKVTRRVATSDLFQVKFCPDCTRKARNAARRAARQGDAPKATAKPAKKPAKKVAKAPATVKPTNDGGLPPQRKGGKLRIRKLIKEDAGALQSGPTNVVTPTLPPVEAAVAHAEALDCNPEPAAS